MNKDDDVEIDDNIYYEDLAENDLVGSPIISEDEIDISDNKLENKTFQLQQLINHFEYRIRGYTLKNNGDKLEFKGNVLMGVESIGLTATMLQPFSREVNMISDKNVLRWAYQNFKTRGDFNVMLLKSGDIPAHMIPVIWRTFSNLFDNVGDIIVGKNSQGVLGGYFGIDSDERIRKRIEKYKDDDGEVVL